VRKNGAATALTVTISGSATTARLTGVDVAVAAGDRLALQTVSGGAPPGTTGVRWSLEFAGTTAKESGYGGPIGFFSSTGARFGGVFSMLTTPQAAAADAVQVVAAAGTLTRTDAWLASSITAGNGLTFYIRKNGVRQDGTGGTVNTACALMGGTTQAAATYSLPLAPGDTVVLEWVVTGTFPSRNWAIGTAFTATTDGQSQICGSSLGDPPAAGAVSFPNAIGIGQVGTVETDFETRALPGVTTIQFSGLQAVLSVAPGAGKSRQVEVRIAGASPGPTVTISDPATAASDTTHTAVLVDGADRWNLRTTPTGSPTVAILSWGLIQGPVVTLIAVPNVVGGTEAAAVTAIEGVGLTVGAITTAVSATIPDGHVISQSPVAGTMVALATAVDLVIAVAPGLVVLVDGIPQRILRDSLSIQATVNGRERLSATLPLPTAAPEILQTIVVTDDGVRIFGGLIDTVAEHAATSATDVPSQLYDLTAVDFNAIPDWRYQNAPRPAETLKTYLAELVTWLYGITLAPDQVDGPLLPERIVAFQTITQILDNLSTVTGYVWNIDYDGVLKMWEPGVEIAPFDILDSNREAVGEITVESAATGYANLVWLFLGDSASREVTETLTADGTTIVTLSFPTLDHRNTLTNNGVEESVGPGGVWEVERQPGTPEIAAAFQLRKSIGGAPAVGAVIVFTYLTQYPLVFQAIDAAEVAAVGFLIETLITEPTVLDHTQGPVIAQAHLDRVSARRREIRYTTRNRDIKPGQAQTITIGNRGLAGSFFITEVETRMQDPLLFRQVTAQQAMGWQGSWREVYRLWAGGGSGGSGGGAVTYLGGGATPPVLGSHHTTHEPGGSDPLAALSASILTTGTLPDARLSANVARRDQANTFVARQTLSATAPELVLTDTSQPANARAFRLTNHVQLFSVEAVNDALTTVISSPLNVNRAGDVFAARDVYEKGRGTPMGHRVAVGYNPAQYGVYPSGSWTVDAADVVTFGYTAIGMTGVVVVALQNTVVTGSPTLLTVSSPIGGPAAGAAGLVRIVIGGVVEEGSFTVQPGDGNIYLSRRGGAAWVSPDNLWFTVITFY